MLDIKINLSKLSDFTQVPKKELKTLIETQGVSPVNTAEKGDNHEYDLNTIQSKLNFRKGLKAPKDQVINILNLKGGVGKSTISIATALGLSAVGYKVLVIDLDEQRNSSGTLLSFRSQQGLKTVTHYLMGEATFDEVTQKAMPLLDVIPGPLFSEGLNAKISSSDNPNKGLFLFEKMFDDNIREKYDFIVIDNPPQNCPLVANSLQISDIVISPVEVQGFSFDGLDDTLNRIAMVEKNSRMIQGFKSIKRRALINRYENRSNSHNFKLVDLSQQYSDILYGYCVPKSNGLVDAIDSKDFSLLFSVSATYSMFKSLNQLILMDAVDGEFISFASDLGRGFIESVAKKINVELE